ncbi:carboxypeptidase-like regulatory domain-containing protein [Rathayibacter sp. ZW T2_19]|uniref:Carboxypeptidase-like regulatory domain-containing protein n=1 Tax=Rathayibacter rubneri TaxID=2950106 RepID=A0A9X2DUJ7_9MICO|nr:carboxypeptidase-like regulatory domain-containing protein [Rathayibacter rubneri]MCM6761477.1 carboxypeptidase-like regulatory domain-containing protein [Rathayibacter rubneri]
MPLLSRAAVRRTLALAAAVLVAGSALATPAYADAPEGTATITGRVLFEGAPDAPPAAGTGVLLLPATTSEVEPVVPSATAADGSFAASVVPGVEYTVLATVEDGLHVLRSLGATGRFERGTVFSADAGETLALPEYVIPLGATISGRVTTDDGLPVPVSAYQGPLVGYTDTVTDANGDYTVRGLDPDLGAVTVAFGSDGDGGAQEWWRDSPTQDGAETIVLTSLDEAVTGIDADLRTRTNPLDTVPCVDVSTLTVSKATSAVRAHLRSHHDLGALKALTRADVLQYLARCA